MTDRFRKGDNVKLTPRYVASMSYMRRKMPTDWSARSGVVISANPLRVTVLWNGLKSYQEFPPMALMINE